MEPELQKYLKILIKMSIGVLALLALYLLVIYVFPIVGGLLVKLPILLMPFIIALVIAVLIEPLVNFFEVRVKLSRGWAVIFSLIIAAGVIFYIISLLIVKIINELAGLYPLLSSLSDQTVQQIIDAVSEFRLFYLQMNLPAEVQNALQDNLQNVITFLKSFTEAAVNGMMQILAALPDMFIFILIAIVATFFIIKDRALIRSFIFKFIPSTAHSQTRDVIAQLFTALAGFFKAYSILISITAVLSIIGLRILGNDYFLTIGLLAGLFDILPILGPGTIFVPWIIWELVAGHMPMGIGLLILYVIISAVRQFAEPKILGDNIGLHPLVTLMSLYVGLKLGGIAGMIAGPVLMVIIIACYRAGVFNSILKRRV
ncbi:MAG TPA: sporulation integral membrane protein YtvI [Syntrophomonadaceae bacterium]|nr:sporulation integral membrane protein YtvI [Syntrophomonadaceae bacterium]HNX28493.1 sporulation integral membrane protein YtvI [Syntrophomonadaceae bacterium]HPR93073.1 sporulation integral membrane protein YtvI [Syntrophomonadaceae bacterium]